MNDLTKPNPQMMDAKRAPAPGWNRAQTPQTYDAYWFVQPQPPLYVIVDSPPPPQTAVTQFSMMTRQMQSMFQMQMNMMREFETRLTRMEQNRPRQNFNGQFYAQTWWALWGILMLILVAALVLVLLLILQG